MTEQMLKALIKNLLVEQFYISKHKFKWDLPLHTLNPDFKLLSKLVNLENLLSQRLNTMIPLIENISAEFNTPRDIVNLVQKALE